MKSPAKIIAEKIATLVDIVPVGDGDETEEVSFGWSEGTNLFTGREPDRPSNCMTVYDTGGGEQSAKLADDMVHVQVRHRNKSYETGYLSLQKIRLALEGISPFSNGAVGVGGIWVLSPVTFIGRSISNHALFTLNFQVLISPEQAGNRQSY